MATQVEDYCSQNAPRWHDDSAALLVVTRFVFCLSLDIGYSP
jgi:hypothetical protein